MKRLLVPIVLAFMVAGCAGNKNLVVEKQHIVIKPPEGLLKCPDVPKPPQNAQTQAEVADWVLRLYQTHQVCQQALKDVENYLEQAERITERVEGTKDK